MPDHRLNSLQSPSAWVQRWQSLAAAGCEVLDLACGEGRHARYLAALGHRVLAIDRDPQALTLLTGVEGVETLEADLETDGWPLGARRFGLVVVTNYLHRPLLPAIEGAVRDDGLLVYETFARGNERFGKPANPAFLLEPGELLEAVQARLRVIAFEDLYVDAPRPAMVQRIAASGPRFEPGPARPAAAAG
jgi:SAM-dependent methyltransferase